MSKNASTTQQPSWPLRSVQDLCAVVTSGGTPSRSNPAYFSPGTVPWIKTGDLMDCYVTKYDEYISEQGVANSSAKLLPADTVLMAMYGATVGRLGILNERAACNQAACAMVVEPSIANPRWLFYALLNDRKRIVSAANGAAQQNLSARTIKEFRYPTPGLDEQKSIAKVLGALDDKIAANAALIETADALARAVFDRMLDDAESVPLTRVAQFVNGKAFTKDATGTGRVVIRIAELNSGIGGSTVYNDIDVADEHTARPGDVLFAWSGSLTLRRWFRPEAIVNQHIFKVLPAKDYPTWCIYGLISRKLDDFKTIAAGKATTMGHIQRRHLEDRVDVPARSAIERHDMLMTTLWNRTLLAEQESLVLAATRDALLPGLMSGRIRVKDAEKTAESVHDIADRECPTSTALAARWG